MGFGDSLRAAEDRKGWKGIVATSSVVPRRPPRLRDSDEIREAKFCLNYHKIPSLSVPLIPCVLYVFSVSVATKLP